LWSLPKKKWRISLQHQVQAVLWKQSTGGEQMGQVPDGFPPNYGILKEHDNLPMQQWWMIHVSSTEF
jgi:hypothetical protein